MFRTSSLVPGSLVLLTITLVGACPATTGTQTGKDGGGTVENFCVSNEDCKAIDEFDECVGGVCQRPCSTDDVCDPDEFCTQQGYCQTGCRDSEGCDGDFLCLEGACRSPDEVGACATKADCVDPPNTNICREGVCVPPPATCERPEDCPGPQQCNGFTDACFDPTPECSAPNDCNGKPQCTNGCTCSSDRKCIATPTCTAETEAADCQSGTYCDTTVTPGRCKASPPCTRQTDCDPFGLACDRAVAQCKRTPACPANACTAPFTQCATAAGFCQTPTCLNGGVNCGGNETCSANGTCTPTGATTCASHTECQATQFCHPGSLTCRTGCRSNSNCSAPDTCNQEGQCVGGTSGGGDGEACDETTPCRSGYSCSGIGVCRENCQDSMCPPCPETGYGCLFVWCVPSAEPPVCP